MADLFKSLVKDSVNDGKGEFFDPYGDLNTLGDDLAYDTLLEIQIDVLQKLESKTDCSIVNAFLNEVNTSDGEEESTSLGVEKIISYMNRVFVTSPESIRATGNFLKDANGNIIKTKRGKNKREFYTQQEQTRRLAETVKLLEQVLQEQKIGGSVSSKLIDSLSNSLSNRDFQQYINEKAEEIEELGVDILEQHGFSAIVSGNLYHAGKQIIEDAFAVKNGSVELGNGLSFTVHVKGGNDFDVKGFSTFDEFFAKVKEFNGVGQIHLSNELYEALQKKSDIKMQAKSGMQQALINAASTGRNSISLQAIGFGASEETAGVLYRYCKYYPHTLKEAQGNSKSLNMYANYLLSKQIALTSLKFNNLYLSEHGFQTASQWMQTANRLLLFKPAIEKYYNDKLGEKHPYSF